MDSNILYPNTPSFLKDAPAVAPATPPPAPPPAPANRDPDNLNPPGGLPPPAPAPAPAPGIDYSKYAGMSPFDVQTRAFPGGLPVGWSWDAWMRANPGAPDPRTTTNTGQAISPSQLAAWNNVGGHLDPRSGAVNGPGGVTYGAPPPTAAALQPGGTPSPSVLKSGPAGTVPAGTQPTGAPGATGPAAPAPVQYDPTKPVEGQIQQALGSQPYSGTWQSTLNDPTKWTVTTEQVAEGGGDAGVTYHPVKVYTSKDGRAVVKQETTGGWRMIVDGTAVPVPWKDDDPHRDIADPGSPTHSNIGNLSDYSKIYYDPVYGLLTPANNVKDSTRSSDAWYDAAIFAAVAGPAVGGILGSEGIWVADNPFYNAGAITPAAPVGGAAVTPGAPAAAGTPTTPGAPAGPAYGTGTSDAASGGAASGGGPAAGGGTPPPPYGGGTSDAASGGAASGGGPAAGAGTPPPAGGVPSGGATPDPAGGTPSPGTPTPGTPAAPSATIPGVDQATWNSIPSWLQQAARVLGPSIVANYLRQQQANAHGGTSSGSTGSNGATGNASNALQQSLIDNKPLADAARAELLANGKPTDDQAAAINAAIEQERKTGTEALIQASINSGQGGTDSMVVQDKIRAFNTQLETQKQELYMKQAETNTTTALRELGYISNETLAFAELQFKEDQNLQQLWQGIFESLGYLFGAQKSPGTTPTLPGSPSTGDPGNTGDPSNTVNGIPTDPAGNLQFDP